MHFFSRCVRIWGSFKQYHHELRRFQNSLSQVVNFCKVAETVEEAKALIENGFEKADEIDGVHIYRKRK